MGAELWYHETPWNADPMVALKELQARFFTSKYDLKVLLPKHLLNARQSVAAAEVDGDEYGLVEIYQEKVRLMERLCQQPIPPNIERQIEILRQIEAASGKGIGNVLDVTSISDLRSTWCAQRLSELDTIRLLGNARPTRNQAENAIGKINGDLRRGECVCFPVFDDESNPLGWYFVGNTVD